MSSVVKYNKVIFNKGKKVLLYNNKIENNFNRLLNKEERVGTETNCTELLVKANQHAQEIILNAKERANEIETLAQQAAIENGEKAQEDGYSKGFSEGEKKGYEQGLAKGRSQGLSEYESLIEEVGQLKEKYTRDYENLYSISEKNMLSLAIDIARKIIGDAIESGGEPLVEVAYNALKFVKGQKQVQLRVSSQDFSKLYQNKDSLISRLEGLDNIDIIDDANLDGGSCIIETGGGSINGSIKDQMDVIESALMGL